MKISDTIADLQKQIDLAENALMQLSSNNPDWMKLMRHRNMLTVKLDILEHKLHQSNHTAPTVRLPFKYQLNIYKN